MERNMTEGSRTCPITKDQRRFNGLWLYPFILIPIAVTICSSSSELSKTQKHSFKHCCNSSTCPYLPYAPCVQFRNMFKWQFIHHWAIINNEPTVKCPTLYSSENQLWLTFILGSQAEFTISKSADQKAHMRLLVNLTLLLRRAKMFWPAYSSCFLLPAYRCHWCLLFCTWWYLLLSSPP